MFFFLSNILGATTPAVQNYPTPQQIFNILQALLARQTVVEQKLDRLLARIPPPPGHPPAGPAVAQPPPVSPPAGPASPLAGLAAFQPPPPAQLPAAFQRQVAVAQPPPAAPASPLTGNGAASSSAAPWMGSAPRVVEAPQNCKYIGQYGCSQVIQEHI